MTFYVEHHSWRKKNKRWAGNIVRKFKKLHDFENYIIATYEKYPDSDIKYEIFECINDTKGTLLSRLLYLNKNFTVITISNKWVDFCYNKEKIIEKINT